MKKISILILALIILLGLGIRLYKLGITPPSLSWDEASIGYDAWSILQDGKDQWGEKLPLIFRSFGEYKYPLHIYTTALFIKVFGLSDYAVRLPSAILGVVNIGLLFVLARLLTGNVILALSSALFLAISPWHIQFSRVNWETNFTLFFFFVGNIFFLKGLKSEKRRDVFLISLSYIFLGLTIFTYNAAKVFVPLYIVLLTILFYKSLLKQKLGLLIGISAFVLIILANLLNPQLSGVVRLQQVNFPNEWITGSFTYQLTQNRYLSRIEIVIKQYISHFSPEFLFISGDKNPRHSSQYTGQIYFFDGLFILLGLFFLIKRRKKEDIALLLWFFLAPIPSSIVKEAPHASRAMFALGSFQIISVVGIYYLFSKIKKSFYKKILLLAVIVVISFSFGRYFCLYLNSYPTKYSQDWQYGYKELFTKYPKLFDDYDQVIVSDRYGQPYIFALYYLKYSPEQFRSEVSYNPDEKKGLSTVSSFSKFLFTDDLKTASLVAGKKIIFMTTKQDIGNLKQVDQIKFLDGSVAFWVYQL